MRGLLVVPLLLVLIPVSAAEPAPNPQIDYAGFQRNVLEVGELRRTHRLSEEEFIRMAAEPGTVVLDARSERLFRLRHIEGAVNLSFPEFTQQTLAALIPTRQTRVLIYCNNNFTGLPESMPVKQISVSLNVSTYVSLNAYGYGNVYELGPLVDAKQTRLRFAGDEVKGAPLSGT